jgi:DNA-binding transcriptional MerR regulator
MNAMMTTTEVAERLDLQPWQIRAMERNGLIPPPTRVGQYRAFCLRDLPVIERAARQYGYIGKAPVMVEA